MASQNSFQTLNVDVPAPDTSVASGAGVPLASPPRAQQSAQPAADADFTIGNALGLAGTPTHADKSGAKRARSTGSADSGEEDHVSRQDARRMDPMNPFRVGDPLNPFAAKYKIMCEKRHEDQVTENAHAAAAAQLAFDNGFHPDRTPFVAQPDEDALDDVLEGTDAEDAASPTVEAVRLKSQRLARAITEPRRSATVAHVPAPAAEAGPAPGVDVFDVDAMDEVEAEAPHALPPPLGTARAKVVTKTSKNELADDVITADEKKAHRKIHPVFENSNILLKVAPSSYDVDGRGPQWALANVSVQQAADWGLYDDPHLLFVVPGQPMNNEMRAATAATLQTIIERVNPDKARKKQPQVASANAQDPSQPLLNIFFGFSIDADVRDGFRVSTGFCVGRDNQLIFTFDLGSHASPFIYTMSGITLKDPVNDAEQVGQLVSTTLALTPSVRTLIIQIKPSLSPTLRQKSDEELVTYFLDSVRVSGMRMVSPTKRGVWITQWNVYMDHAHLFQSQHRTLRTTIASVPIVTSFFGTGRMIKKHWYCSTCMSISHPTGLCPFTALPGWAAIATTVSNEPNDISNRLGEAAEGSTGGRGSFRGGRGGSRGSRGFHGGRGGRGGGKF